MVTENNETKAKKPSKLFALLTAFGIYLFIMFIIFHIASLQSASKSHVAASNSIARAHYNMLTNGVIDVKNLLYIPREGVYTLYGESNDFMFYRVYPDEYIESETVIYGKNDDSINSYWAVRFNNGRVTEVWCAKFPLSEEDLLPYTVDEQLKQVKFLGGFSSEEVIGYYNALNKKN